MDSMPLTLWLVFGFMGSVLVCSLVLGIRELLKMRRDFHSLETLRKLRVSDAIGYPSPLNTSPCNTCGGTGTISVDAENASVPIKEVGRACPVCGGPCWVVVNWNEPASSMGRFTQVCGKCGICPKCKRPRAECLLDLYATCCDF